MHWCLLPTLVVATYIESVIIKCARYTQCRVNTVQVRMYGHCALVDGKHIQSLEFTFLL